jgi:hypothetical protein
MTKLEITIRRESDLRDFCVRLMKSKKPTDISGTKRMNDQTSLKPDGKNIATCLLRDC